MIKDRQFEKIREGVRGELLSANEHFNIISQFLDAPREITAITRKYQTFFFYTQLAHIKLLCISLYNVTKYNEQTGNIPRWLCYIRFHRTLSTRYLGDISAIEEKLKSHTDFLACVYTLRDQYYAHNQLKRKKLEITLENIRDGCKTLLPDLHDMYDSLSLKYDRSTWVFTTVPSININELLTDLTAYKKMIMLGRSRHRNG